MYGEGKKEWGGLGREDRPGITCIVSRTLKATNYAAATDTRELISDDTVYKARASVCSLGCPTRIVGTRGISRGQN